jgi:hypothetical protein
MTKKRDLTRAINDVADEVNSVLNSRSEDRYFQEIALLYSFIENILKWLVWINLMWKKTGSLSVDSMLKLRSFCDGLSFYQAVNFAYSVDLIGEELYAGIDSIRNERNSVIHQLWLYDHRSDMRALRTNLEALAKVSNDLVTIFNRLTKEIGIDEVYEMYFSSWNKTKKEAKK